MCADSSMWGWGSAVEVEVEVDMFVASLVVEEDKSPRTLEGPMVFIYMEWKPGELLLAERFRRWRTCQD
jgi:hypothetical protein